MDNIAVCIPTRNRPLALIGVIMSLWRLRHSDHLIFLVGSDADDAVTGEAVSALAKEKIPVAEVVAPRSCLGAVNNRLALAAKQSGADILVTCSDRTVPITYQWDAAIRYTVDRYPFRVSWWSSPQSAATELPIIPKPFLQALEWRWCSEIYPFWFDDLALGEIDAMVFGRESIKSPAAYAGERSKTNNARDIAFWWRVFAAQRVERWKQAEQIARFFDIKPSAKDVLNEMWTKRDAASISRADDMQASFGDRSPASPMYVAMKMRAEALL